MSWAECKQIKPICWPLAHRELLYSGPGAIPRQIKDLVCLAAAMH